MYDRDIEELMLLTIHSKLVEITGIPSGLVYARMPDYEFVNKFDGNRQPATNKIQFPSIGMRYWDKVKYSTNTYGEDYIVDLGSGIVLNYQPQGEICLPLSIYLFTDTSKEQRRLSNKIMSAFADYPFYELLNDEIEGEYLGIEFIGFNDLQAHEPYVRCIDIKANSRTLREVSGYVVDQVDLTLQSRTNSIAINTNEQDKFVYGLEIPPETIEEETIYFQDWNIVPVDLTDSFGGIFERTEDASIS